jgi:MOSC domain-containing protein
VDPQLTDIRIYPLKSASGIRVTSAPVEPWGLRGDRGWAIVDAGGRHPWLGDHPRSLAIHAEATADGGLILRSDGQDDVVARPDECGPPMATDFPGLSHVLAGPAEASVWISKVMDADLRLVRLPPGVTRPVGPEHGGRPGDVTSFAWDAPVHLVTRESLRRLEEWIAETANEDGTDPGGVLPLDAARFRPNLVTEGFPAFAEDEWAGVRIGETEFRVTERVDRCAVTLYDPASIAKAKEPIRTLARHRAWSGKTWFGIRLAPLAPGRVEIGSPVQPK